MQISSRFTMANHMFACIDTFSDQKMTSDFMAGSIGTNPVIIRKLLQQLKAAGLIEVSNGTEAITDDACRCEKRCCSMYEVSTPMRCITPMDEVLCLN